MEVYSGLVKAVRSVNEALGAKVPIAGQTSEEFKILNRIEQGGSLSPLLFIFIEFHN